MADQIAIEVIGGVREQSTDEERAWAIDVSNVAAAPAAPTIVFAYDEADPATDVASTIFPSGGPSVASTVITLPILSGAALTVGTMYRIFLSFTDSGNTHGVFFRLWVPARVAAKSLVSVSMCLEYMETDISGAQLQRLIDEADALVVKMAGPHPLDGDRTEDLIGGRPLLFLPEPAASITSVTEYSNAAWLGATTTLLSANDHRSVYEGSALQRLADGDNPATVWTERVVVVYATTDNNATRRNVILDLVQLAVNRQPGIQSERIGDFSRVNLDYDKERCAIIQRVTANYGGAAAFV